MEQKFRLFLSLSTLIKIKAQNTEALTVCFLHPHTKNIKYSQDVTTPNNALSREAQ